MNRGEWHTLASLPGDVRAAIRDVANMPSFIRADLAASAYGVFGYHVGSVAAMDGAPFTLAPSDDKGYGYGVFFSLDRPAVEFAGGKRYRRKPEHLFVYVVPVDDLCHFRYSPHGDLVGCTNGRAVVLRQVKCVTLGFEEAVETLHINRPALDELLKRYQRNARDVLLYWAAGYDLPAMSSEDARRLREGGQGVVAG